MFAAVEPPVGEPIALLEGVRTPNGAVVLASSVMVTNAIQDLAAAIRPWIDENPENPAVLVALLEGGKYYADRLTALLRDLCTASFTRLDVKVSTRDSDGRPLSTPDISGPTESLRGRRVLILDDVLDSGMTLRLTTEVLVSIAAQLRSSVLIQKDNPNAEPTDSTRPQADFVGIRFSDTRWFSGVGMDMPGDPEGKARQAPLVIAYPPVF